MFGNGSDELIQILILAMGGEGRAILSPVPGFVMYRMIAQAGGSRFVPVPLNAGDFSLDADAMRDAIEREQPAVVFLAWPNNPTGNLFDRHAVLDIIRRAPGLVVIDEAYSAFAQDSFIGELGKFDNLLLMRTLSKTGFAGLRLGYLLGPRAWLEQIDKVRLPYNTGTLAQITAEHALEYMGMFEAQAERIRRDRGLLYEALDKIDGIEAWPSAANFLLFRAGAGLAPRIYERLRELGVLIRNLDGSDPLLHDCLRVTVGTPRENEAFLEALRGIMRDPGL